MARFKREGKLPVEFDGALTDHLDSDISSVVGKRVLSGIKPTAEMYIGNYLARWGFGVSVFFGSQDEAADDD